jgi:hypothetical protein
LSGQLFLILPFSTLSLLYLGDPISEIRESNRDPWNNACGLFSSWGQNYTQILNEEHTGLTDLGSSSTSTLTTLWPQQTTVISETQSSHQYNEEKISRTFIRVLWKDKHLINENTWHGAQNTG